MPVSTRYDSASASLSPAAMRGERACCAGGKALISSLVVHAPPERRCRP
jgi:hypothetical protein